MPSSSSPYADRLHALRALLHKEGLGGFLVPMADPYLSEYVPPSDQRILFLTGFTGSFAFVIVLADKALFFTDSRYTLQAEAEIPLDLFTLYDVADVSVRAWMTKNLRGPLTVGFDPRLHAASQVDSWQKGLKASSVRFHACASNPVDALWTERPKRECVALFPHPDKYAGKSASDKRAELAAYLTKRSLDAVVLTDAASIAWLLNVRGGDVPNAPLPLCTAIVRADAKVELFLSGKERAQDVVAPLGPDVTVCEEIDFILALSRLGEARCRVFVDPEETPYVTFDALILAGARLEKGQNPCLLPKACKNDTEIEGMRSAHRRDGAALVKTLAWLENALAGDGATALTEMDVCAKLESFRSESALHRGPSFPTIAGSGPNGAIVHYRPTEKTARRIDKDSFLLIDSGAQYVDGTTDVTRTLVTGTVTQDMREKFTRVLKGHIALASIRFPSGTGGAELDVLARQYLWEIGEDYGHGTGHGVGAYLSVHEGPQGISRRATCALRAGMVVSNEPGFYKPRSYGIRHENLQCVVALPEISSPGRAMLGFETLTLAPFDRKGIESAMLTVAEKAWLNAYHARVEKALLPQVDSATAQWLHDATAPL